MVVIAEKNDGAGGLGDRSVAGVIQTLAGFEDMAGRGRSSRKRGHGFTSIIGGIVVDDQDFEVAIGKVLPQHPLQRLP